ncbi:MAG: hypothetical protein V9F00_08285 [Nocardioides sp.]|jgi:hypothetical protein
MGSTPLSGEEMALLPPIRPRWQAHVVALVCAAVGLGAWLLVSWERRTLDDLAAARGTLAFVALVLLELATLAAPWLILVPLIFKVGFDWRTALILMVIPFTAPFVGWVIGFRLAHLPYRNWRPSDKQRPTVRLIPGTGYHVLQADLDRLAKHEHTLQASRTYVR